MDFQLYLLEFFLTKVMIFGFAIVLVKEKPGIWLDVFVLFLVFPSFLPHSLKFIMPMNMPNLFIMLCLLWFFNLDGLQHKFHILPPFRIWPKIKMKEQGKLSLETVPKKMRLAEKDGISKKSKS